jgi:hypothetical protein
MPSFSVSGAPRAQKAHSRLLSQPVEKDKAQIRVDERIKQLTAQFKTK